MADSLTRQPRITRFYYRYVDEGNVADFLRNVTSCYTPATLERVLENGDRGTRRGAALALTVWGLAESIPQVVKCLQDNDRGVRMIAEQGLPAMWQRVGTLEQNGWLQRAQRCFLAAEFRAALRWCDRVVEQNPRFGVAWHLRAEILFALGNVFEAMADLQKTLECEPSHYPSAWELAQCFGHLGDTSASLQWVRRVLQIHPHFELARLQYRRLQRELREQSDR